MTLDHVASEAGVSKATVSRVINERGNVSPETVRLVREAMVRARYSPPAPKPPKGQPNLPRKGQPSALSAYALLVPEISGDLYASLLLGFEAARPVTRVLLADVLDCRDDRLLPLELDVLAQVRGHQGRAVFAGTDAVQRAHFVHADAA